MKDYQIKNFKFGGEMKMDRSKKVVNDLLTDVFNQILILEDRTSR